MSVLLLDREILHYEVLGRGKPVILLHGWVGSWRYWIPVMQAASISYRTYALDLWGFGDSTKNPARYAFAEQVKLIETFLTEMGIGRAALVGHGLGALAALAFAHSHPDVIDRVMAVSCPFTESQIHSRLRTQSPAGLVDWLLSKSSLAEPVRLDAAKTDPAAVLASLNGWFSSPWSLDNPNEGTACLMVHGQEDPLVNAPTAIQLMNLPDTAHAMLFDESGHFPMIEESSKFNRLLIDFLALKSGDSPRELQFKDEWKRRVR